jgi:hypothetical protein
MFRTSHLADNMLTKYDKGRIPILSSPYVRLPRSRGDEKIASKNGFALVDEECKKVGISDNCKGERHAQESPNHILLSGNFDQIVKSINAT